MSTTMLKLQRQLDGVQIPTEASSTTHSQALLTIDNRQSPRMRRTRCFRGVSLIALLLLFGPVALAHAQAKRVGHVEVELIAQTQAVVPGQPLRVGLRIKHDPHWHTYTQDPGDSGMPTELRWKLPVGFAAGSILWPKAQRIVLGGLVNNVYEGEIVLPVDIQTPAKIEGDKVTLAAEAVWLMCREECVPGSAELSLTLPAGPGPAASDARWAALFAAAVASVPQVSPIAEQPRSLGLMLLYALLGGAMLNLMPCVFPVLSIKILGFVQQAGEDRRKILQHGLAFAAGVLISFWLLTAVLLALRGGGEQLGWGFQLQRPGFVAVMALLLMAVGLNLAGVFEFGAGLMTLAGKAQVAAEGKGGLTASLLSGVLATVIATPCTAPLMGPAVGAALTLPIAQTLLIFTALGVGMAMPYVLLSAFPAWLNVLPRPGAWMVTFRQLMSFPMFAAAIWLAWVFGQQVAGIHGMMLLLIGMLLLSMAAWVLGKWGQPHRKPGVRRSATVVALLLLLLAVATPLNAARWLASDQTLAWQSYTEGELDLLRKQGRTVLVDFTADWCLTCKFNEHTVLATDTVKQAVAKHKVALLKADWTSRDETVTAALARFGRNSVPLYVVYGVRVNDPIVLPTVITPTMIADALAQASPP
ncbi:MAG: thioredoxin family protein [Phycisphaeraceae bacterium]|nr:thioredoxin family protein [Phycisphaeraceae bacterium]